MGRHGGQPGPVPVLLGAYLGTAGAAKGLATFGLHTGRAQRPFEPFRRGLGRAG